MATLEPPHLQPGPPLIALLGEDSNTAAATASASKHEDPSPKATLGFISQASCYLHRYTRNDSDAHIVERADRLRSVFMGVAVAHGRFKATKLDKGKGREDVKVSEDISDLEKLLGGMRIAASKDIAEGWPFSISSVSRTLPLQSAAVDFAHGPDYSQKLLAYISDVAARHANKESEVPEPLSQGDLYLCQESLQALEGALGACCEGVDQICQDRTSVGARRFVSIRPPGHHCESENPMGFCWLNNVAVAAAHAHLEHGIDRVIIFDIDLHHGNGTQEIAWRLNSMAHKAIYARQKPLSPRKQSPKKPVPAAIPPKPALQVFYGSLHDVDSYPCEDMDPTLIANASVNISGGGGSQYITNVHLEPYDDHQDFHERLYPLYQARLMNSAHAFLQKTKAVAKNTLVIISAGFDASEHEYASMSRHGARVPTSFFSRFARDAVSFADTEAEGKLLAVLEGGYSQRALASGAGSFVSGLMDVEDLSRETLDSWWSTQNLEVYEKALAPPTSRGKRGAISPSKAAASGESDWQGPALAIFSKLIETLPSKPIPAKSKEKNVTPPSSNVRTTRSRYNSPAQPVKLNGETNSSAEPQQKVVPVKTEEVPLETPITSPLIARQNPSSVFPPATPVIRFTFKAAEDKLQQPDVFAGQYQDARSGTEPSGSDGKSDSSD